MSLTLPPLPFQFPTGDPLCLYNGTCVSFFFPLSHPTFLPQEGAELKEREVPAMGSQRRVVYTRREKKERENKETDGSVRCVCLIAPVFAFSASLVPSGRLSPWTHWTVLSLSRGSSPFSSPSPSARLSLSLPGSFKDVCVCLCVGVHG